MQSVNNLLSFLEFLTNFESIVDLPVFFEVIVFLVLVQSLNDLLTGLRVHFNYFRANNFLNRSLGQAIELVPFVYCLRTIQLVSTHAWIFVAH